MAQEGDESDEGSIYGLEQEEEDGSSGYYDECDIEDLSPRSLRRLQFNNPFYENLSITSNNWIEGTGIAIRNHSAKLQGLIVDCDRHYEINHWLLECCLGISHNRSLQSLSLYSYLPDLDLFQILTPFFKHNNNFRSLERTDFYSERSLTSLCLAMSHCNKDNWLKEIKLESVNHRRDEDVGALFDLIVENFCSLSTLRFRRIYLERIGCISFANLLHNPISKIKDLQLGQNRFDAECMMILRDALITNSSLEAISVYGHPTFATVDAWRIFCTIFAHEMCTIKELYIGATVIFTGGATILGSALAANTSLIYMQIVQDDAITAVGWQGLSTCIDNLYSNILPRILSDKTSIDNTHSSNHTLCKITPISQPFEKDIRRLLKMNKNKDKVKVARQKILQQHFSEGNANIPVFATMPETSLPFAIAWIGRNKDGRTLMYNFAQAFPSLLDIGHK